ncbi:putative cell wall-associated hydrolase [Yersinia enterocolitica]|nr:putative cell wall-associated hydrolase [Yersinia enterocolitica]
MSRHRGAKHRRRYELLGGISLLSPEYLLSVERLALPFRTTGSLRPTFVPARAVTLAVKLAYAFALTSRCPTVIS